MFPMTGLFGQTARMFHTPEFAELREAMSGADDRDRASSESAQPTVPPQAASRPDAA